MSRKDILEYLNDFSKQLAQLSRPHFPDIAALFDDAAEKSRPPSKAKRAAPRRRDRKRRRATPLRAATGAKAKLAKQKR